MCKILKFKEEFHFPHGAMIPKCYKPGVDKPYELDKTLQGKSAIDL